MFITQTSRLLKNNRSLTKSILSFSLMMICLPIKAQESQTAMIMAQSEHVKQVAIKQRFSSDMQDNMEIIPMRILGLQDKNPSNFYKGMDRFGKSKSIGERIADNKYIALGVGIFTVSLVAILVKNNGGIIDKESGQKKLPMPVGRPDY